MKLVAFLRAINVGGHVVTMETLRKHFGALGLREVETFIASGNVLFDSPERNTAAIERRVETHLAATLADFVAKPADPKHPPVASETLEVSIPLAASPPR